MKNLIPLIVFIVILAIGGYYLLVRKPDTVTSTIPTEQPAEIAPAKSFDIKGANYSFDVKEIKVKKGDTVKINFTNDEGFHDLKIDEFNAATPQLQAGQSATIQFVADQVGSFQYYCSVGQHRQNGMWGTLIVEE